MSDRTKPQHKADKAELRNEDPISGEAGAHPVGVGLGTAVGGAAAGAAAGLAAGPIGTVAGAVIGGVVGGLAGKGIAENIDPTVELDYWKNEYRNRDYFDDKRSFDDYAPAYHAGISAYDPTSPEDWNAREALARQQYESSPQNRGMLWDDAKCAAEDAYCRLQQNRPTSDLPNRSTDEVPVMPDVFPNRPR